MGKKEEESELKEKKRIWMEFENCEQTQWKGCFVLIVQFLAYVPKKLKMQLTDAKIILSK